VILTETTARSVVVLYLRQVLDLQRGDAMSPRNQGEPSLIERRHARRARLATAHGAFLVATGLWPLVSLETFEAVSGRKDEPWLVKTVGLVLATLGVVLWQSRREESRAQIELGRLPALALAGIDLWYAGIRRCISPVYLADGVVEIGLAVAWTMVARGDAAPSQAPDGAVLS